jgi:hypothetical protein
MTHKTVYYVNRNRYNRKRHVDPDCRALKRARQSSASPVRRSRGLGAR